MLKISRSGDRLIFNQAIPMKKAVFILRRGPGVRMSTALIIGGQHIFSGFSAKPWQVESATNKYVCLKENGTEYFLNFSLCPALQQTTYSAQYGYSHCNFAILPFYRHLWHLLFVLVRSSYLFSSVWAPRLILPCVRDLWYVLPQSKSSS